MLRGVGILIGGLVLLIVGVFLTVLSMPYVVGILGFMFLIAYIPSVHLADYRRS